MQDSTSKLNIAEEKQEKMKEGVVKRTIMNGLIKNNFSYATVKTETIEVTKECQ